LIFSSISLFIFILVRTLCSLSSCNVRRKYARNGKVIFFVSEVVSESQLIITIYRRVNFLGLRKSFNYLHARGGAKRLNNCLRLFERRRRRGNSGGFGKKISERGPGELASRICTERGPIHAAQMKLDLG
jgi:hypothetical protein